MHGIDFSNASIKSYISGTSVPLVYWGKKSVTITTSNLNKDVDLFNLPSSWSVSTFFISETSGKLVYITAHNRSSTWKLNIDWINAVGNRFTVYAFVEAKNIPTPKWGMAIYNTAGKLVFHTARPALYLTDINNYTGSYKPASSGEAYKFNSRRMGGRGTRMMNTISFKGAYRSGSTYKLGGSLNKASSSIGLYVRTFTTAAPIIDAGYYDRFPSLGNR